MGIVSGVVTYSSGQAKPGAKVEVSVGGINGGFAECRTDSQGRFLCQWNGNAPARKIFCEGREVARDIESGSSNLHFIG